MTSMQANSIAVRVKVDYMFYYSCFSGTVCLTNIDTGAISPFNFIDYASCESDRDRVCL